MFTEAGFLEASEQFKLFNSLINIPEGFGSEGMIKNNIRIMILAVLCIQFPLIQR